MTRPKISPGVGSDDPSTPRFGIPNKKGTFRDSVLFFFNMPLVDIGKMVGLGNFYGMGYFI